MKQSLLISLLAFFVVNAMAQDHFAPLDQWLERETPQMGGRAVLLIYKDGKLVYSNAENALTRRQKMAGRWMARRQKKEVNLDDFTPGSKIPIASCSKWLSAALVMTFADEGKLQLSDT
ncbi:MAG: serine hydrolase, partial [Chitinophagaceae bacterium]|nr:serine hydrolase [Chitinophagaceae bacterium]